MKKKIKKHNPTRYGETYDVNWINAQIEILENIRELVVLSGGWAWHFISPAHTEYKHIHDHKDIDIFVPPENFTVVQLKLTSLGFYRMKTKYDNNTFIRYEKIQDDKKIVIDMFKKEVPNITVKGWNVVDPNYLLSLYYSVHQSDHCIAVQASRDLLSKGEEIIDNEELIKLPIEKVIEKHRKINELFEEGKDIDPELTKNFV
jgi:hypothetical protein